jgi:cytochrome c-type biogenesis protein CcmH/NrfG
MNMKPLAAILSLVLANAVYAADTSGPASRPDPMLDRYHAAAERQDWKLAAAAMNDALGASPGNADYHSLYAYALRKSGSGEMDVVFKHYNEALRLDPKHRGAHEYIGEAYLMVGNVGKAKEHLSALDKICFFGCSEYNDLKKAISETEAKTVKQ